MKLGKILKNIRGWGGRACILGAVGYSAIFGFYSLLGNKKEINENINDYSFEVKRIQLDLSIKIFERTISEEGEKEDNFRGFTFFNRSSFSFYDGGNSEHDGKVDKIYLKNYEYSPDRVLNGDLKREEHYSKFKPLFDLADKELAKTKEKYKSELAELEKIVD